MKEKNFTFKSDYETWVFSKSKTKAFELIRTNTSEILWFYFENITTPHEAWDKLEIFFGKVDIIKVIQIEAQLIALSQHLNQLRRLLILRSLILISVALLRRRVVLLMTFMVSLVILRPISTRS